MQFKPLDEHLAQMSAFEFDENGDVKCLHQGSRPVARGFTVIRKQTSQGTWQVFAFCHIEGVAFKTDIKVYQEEETAQVAANRLAVRLRCSVSFFKTTH